MKQTILTIFVFATIVLLTAVPLVLFGSQFEASRLFLQTACEYAQ